MRPTERSGRRGGACRFPRSPRVWLAEGFRRAVLEFLLRKGTIAEELHERRLLWRHSGFSAHNQVRVGEGDAKGRKKLAGTMLHAPMALEKMRYDARRRAR